MNGELAIGDYRDVLEFWKARSTIAALLATIALILRLFGYETDLVVHTDWVLEGITTIGYAWAYIERLFGRKRLVIKAPD
jgi:hypothetical protein